YLESARAASASRGVAGFASVQDSYSLLDRAVEREVLLICAREGLGFTPYSPLAGGWLTGRYRRGAPPPPGSRMTLRPEAYGQFVNARTFDALDRFQATARARGTDTAAMALAWLLGDSRVCAVIVGPRRPAQFDL